MNKQKAIINVLLVYVLMFVSGALLFKLSSEKLLMAAFLLSLVAWVFYSDRKINLDFILYLIALAGFLLLIHFYTDGSLSFATVLGTALRLVIAYLILKTVGKDFTQVYVNVIVFLAVCSLLGYLSDQLHLFSGLVRMLPKVGDTGYGGVLYVFRYHYQGYDRNNSIFFEPGAYQIFINVGLFILLFIRLNLSTLRRWTYVSVLLVTLLTTFSTTGFLIFALMLGLFLLNSKIVSATGKTVMLTIMLLSTVLFAAQFKEVIIEKIQRYMSIEDITDKKDRRSFDMLVDLEIIKRHKLGIGHREYFELFSATGLVRKSSSSNGVTKLLAIYGVPFALFYFGSFYLAFRRLLGSLGMFMGIVPFGMFLMFLVGESYFLFVLFTFAVVAGVFAIDKEEQDNKIRQ